MLKRTILSIYNGENGKSEVIDEKEERRYEIQDAIAGCLKRIPEESFIFKPNENSATVVLRSYHTRAVAFYNGMCIGTKKELKKVARQELDEGDIFFCAWTDPDGQAHLIWIEHMKKKYQNCTVSIAGYEPEEVRRLSKVILWAMLQTKVGKTEKYKALLEKEFGNNGCDFMIGRNNDEQNED